MEPDGALGASRHTSDFQNLHRNKRSITLNLKEPEAIEILMKLVETSDVVVENFRPDVKDRLGINYDNLKKGILKLYWRVYQDLVKMVLMPKDLVLIR